MKQIIQSLNNGDTSLIDVPAPMVSDGHLLIQTTHSLVSAGTERMLLDFGKANWMNKARQQPERVKAVLDKIKTDGLKPTIDAVVSKLNQPIPLGYSNAGVVIGVGNNVTNFKIGDRVASNGSHAEIVSVPQSLAAKIPDNVSDESAAFTVVSAIALQGIRLANPTFGETVVVVGLGLIGQITVQLLKANACRVIGIDADENRCKQAEQFGISVLCNKNIENLPEAILSLTQGIGADAVIITAATKENTLIADAAQMSRKRGRIVLVGVVGLQLNRSDFYEKELTFQVSCSYGPGRYDYDYEQKGNDYPIAFVRWTAQRNFEAVLQAMSQGLLKLESLISQRVKLESYANVYSQLSDTQNLASIFQYDLQKQHTNKIALPIATSNQIKHRVALIGAGAFAAKVIVPALKTNGIVISTVASAKGLSAAQLAKQNNLSAATTDVTTIWNDANIETVVIATQHHSHAQLCIDALHAGKHVFVEKPLAIHLDELERVIAAYRAANRIVDVGFNRRHSPLAVKAKQLLGDYGQAINISMTINAGSIPANHWLSDAEKNGGRVVGELCHFIDLAAFWAQSAVKAVCANSLINSNEDVCVLLRFENGSAASIQYFTNGNKAYDKERFEIYDQGKVLVLENWKRLTGYGFKSFSSSSAAQDKGHQQQFKLLANRLKNGGSALVPFDSIVNTSKAALMIEQSLREQSWIQL